MSLATSNESSCYDSNGPAVGMSVSASGVSLTAGQVAALLPLLQQGTSSSADAKSEPPFSVGDMLRRKPKNARSTTTQNFLLVS